MTPEDYQEELDKKIIDTRLNPEITGLARETEVLTMKFVEVKKFEEKIEVSFLEKTSYYIQIAWKLIKITYPIILPLFTVIGWLQSLKTKKR